MASSNINMSMASFLSHRIVFLLVLLLAVPSPSVVRSTDGASSLIRLNTVGFLPEHQKRASIAAPATTFSVVNDADGKVVFQGRTSAPVHNSDTNEELA